MSKKILFSAGCCLFAGFLTCAQGEAQLKLDETEAARLIQLPLVCMDTEYPNQLGQVLSDSSDLGEPASLHPAFYGCYDWHSAVHGHWSLVRILNLFPEVEGAEKAKTNLIRHLSATHIATEIAYFDKEHNKTFERMYGWAWLLKLTTELRNAKDPEIRALEANVKPLADTIAARIRSFLPRLHYPIRVGTHTNSAFALCMVFDYAKEYGDHALLDLVVQRSKEYYLADQGCPMGWEPSGYDFLSPCLEEVNIMRRVLDGETFRTWLKGFMPEMSGPEYTLAPGIVSDRKDGHLVHLDGLNFSRAWCLYGIAETLPEYRHLIPLANAHILHSLPELVGDSYEGGHWLASFALLSLSAQK